jgi:hypothetical protein
MQHFKTLKKLRIKSCKEVETNRIVRPITWQVEVVQLCNIHEHHAVYITA